jgi:hypothetical protein
MAALWSNLADVAPAKRDPGIRGFAALLAKA